MYAVFSIFQNVSKLKVSAIGYPRESFIQNKTSLRKASGQKFVRNFVFCHYWLNPTYTDFIVSILVFFEWIIDSVTESKFSEAWQAMVPYQKIVFCKEDVGIERALGARFFSSGGFPNDEIYIWYNQVRIISCIKCTRQLSYLFWY